MIDAWALTLLHQAARGFSTQRTPAASDTYTDSRNLELNVVVAGLPRSVTVAPSELIAVYGPLIRMLCEARASAGRRLVVGLAGIPGSGKSTLAAVLLEFWRHLRPGPLLSVVGMDGWHRTNAELDRRLFVAEDGSTMPLRRRKGSPPSFDAVAFAAALRCIRQSRGDVRIPVYDRRRHEPVRDAGVVPAEADIVLVEGNYLLLDTGEWSEVTPQIDLKLWLDIDPDACREGITARHVAGGLSPDQAARKYAENDLPNAQIALATRHRADWVIRSDPRHRLTGLCLASSLP